MAKSASTTSVPEKLRWLADARVGMFCHYGLYSLLGRGEWTMNREGITPAQYEPLADRFTAKKFDADELADLAVELGAKYIVFTTKHHEGFCHFDSKLTDFTSVKRGPKRDLVREVVDAARKRKLRIGLYYSLNDWGHEPSGLDAFEDYTRHGKRGKTYTAFIEYIMGQARELMSNYGHIDTMWYDGWWPFDAEGWQAQRMNAMVRKLQPHVLFNNRNCLPGDFATPEQHVTAVKGRVWEACLTLNDSWGYHAGDHNWKSPRTLFDAVVKGAKEGGNLLINVGPRGDGSIPAESKQILRTLGKWVHANEEALRPGMTKAGLDWNHHCTGGGFTARPGVTYMHVTNWPGTKMVLRGVKGKVKRARFVDPRHRAKRISIKQSGDRLELTLPRTAPDKLATVIALEHTGTLTSYQTGGMRIPRGKHPQYDPVDSNLIAPP